MSAFSPRRLLAAVLLCLLPAGAVAAATLVEKVQEHTLANGLRLLVVERPDAATFSAQLTVNVGSVDESENNRGLAHFLEHLRFKGTRVLGVTDYRAEQPLLEAIEATGNALDALRRQPRPAADEVQRLEERLAELQQQHRRFVVTDEAAQIYARHGAVGFNAFTSKDQTSYVVSLPANKLELWAWIEADRMRNAVLREFYTEREVVLEERRRNYDGDPDGLLYEHLLATAFNVHPYRHPIIGWESDIRNLSPAAARRFMHGYYAPANTVIALVGNLRFEVARDLVERYFGAIPAGLPRPPVAAVEPEQRGERRVQVFYDAEPRLSLAFHKATLPQREDYVFDVLDQILTAGRTSRLYRSLVVEQHLATAVTGYTAPGARYPHLYVIAATPRHPHSLAEVEQALLRELERLGREPVSAEELQRARTRLRLDRLRFLQSNSGLARMLTYFQVVAGDWRYLVDYDDQIASVSAEEIMGLARKTFRTANRTVATLERKGS